MKNTSGHFYVKKITFSPFPRINVEFVEWEIAFMKEANQNCFGGEGVAKETLFILYMF